METRHYLDFDKKTEEEKAQVEDDIKRLLMLHKDTSWFDNWVRQYKIDKIE